MTMHVRVDHDDNGPSAHMDTVVHFGAGLCSELDAYLAMKPHRLVLVEAEAQLAEALVKRTAGLPHVQVVRAAIAAHPGSGLFHRYSLPGVGSLHRASGLAALFPGLRALEPLPVETVSPVPVLEPLALEDQRSNLLVVDLPGEELPVLTVLRDAGQLQLFTQIRLHCGHRPLYEGGEPAARILGWLNEQGFDLVGEDKTQDPDRPSWTLQRNALQARMQALQCRFDELNQEKQGLETTIAMLQSDLAEQQRQTTHWMNAAEATKAEAVERGRLVAVTESELHRRLVQAHEERERLLQERETEIGRWTGEKAALEAQLAQRHARIETLTAEMETGRQEAKRQADRLETEKLNLEQVGNDLREQLAEQQRQTQFWMDKLNTEKMEMEALRQRINQLEQSNAERDQRQRQLDDELLKAEAQIDLIKDVLLRENAL